jgi:hypothetical protein
MSSPISSSTVTLVGLGVGELPIRVKMKGEFQSNNTQAKVGKVLGMH